MEIIDKPGSAEFYDEVFSVMYNYKRILKNPRRKFHGLSYNFILLTIVSLIFLVIFKILHMIYGHIIFIVITIIFTIIFAWSFIIYFFIRNKIYDLQKYEMNNKLIIEAEYIKFQSLDDESCIMVAELKYILINKYSISFIPKMKNKKNKNSRSFLPKKEKIIIISIDVEFKGTILDIINCDDMIVDNSDLY